MPGIEGGVEEETLQWCVAAQCNAWHGEGWFLVSFLAAHICIVSAGHGVALNYALPGYHIGNGTWMVGKGSCAMGTVGGIACCCG
eukprot:2564885-Rhodomonas_salina.1